MPSLTFNFDMLLPVRSREQKPADETVVFLAGILSARFVQRYDCYPQQLDDGRYVTIHKPLQPASLVAHLRGELTLGTYLLDKDSYGRFAVFDADTESAWQDLTYLAQSLGVQRIASYLERSRRGGHLWLFFASAIGGRTIRTLGKGLLTTYGIGNVELYPKQDMLTSGPGSVIRLPFGVHRVSGRRYSFYTAEGQPLAPTLSEQIAIFGTPQVISEQAIEHLIALSLSGKGKTYPGALHVPTNAIRKGDEGALLSERLKTAVSVRDFVIRYVELCAHHQGLCPFHDDHHPSFSVNSDKNYWHCFACGKGGSIIDFWMQYRACDFRTALKELAKMLL